MCVSVCVCVSVPPSPHPPRFLRSDSSDLFEDMNAAHTGPGFDPREPGGIKLPRVDPPRVVVELPSSGSLMARGPRGSKCCHTHTQALASKLVYEHTYTGHTNTHGPHTHTHTYTYADTSMEQSVLGWTHTHAQHTHTTFS